MKNQKTILTNRELYHLITPEVDLVKLNTQFPDKKSFRQQLIKLAYESVIRNKFLNYPQTSWRFKKASQLMKDVNFSKGRIEYGKEKKR